MKRKRYGVLLTMAMIMSAQLVCAKSEDVSTLVAEKETHEELIKEQADLSMTEEKALEIANEFLQKIDYDPLVEYDSYLEKRNPNIYKSVESWKFFWEVNIKDDNVQGANSYELCVSAETGVVTNFYLNGKHQIVRQREDRLHKITLPSVNVEEGTKIARSYVDKIDPRFKTEVELTKTYPDHLSYRFNEIVNGLANPYKQINIGLNNETGRIETYRIIWDDGLTFSNLEGVHTKDEAKELYADALTMKYSYRAVKDENNNIKGAKPVYKPKVNICSLRAKVLEPLHVHTGETHGNMDEFIISEERIASYRNQYVVQPTKQEKATKEEIMKLANAYLNIVDENSKVAKIGTTYDRMGEELWYVSYANKETDGGALYFNARGKMIRLHSYGDETDSINDEVKVLTLEELAKKAEKILCTMYPKELEQVDNKVKWDSIGWQIDGIEYPEIIYSFRISPAGINDFDSGIDISMGVYSGNVTRIENNWFDFEEVDECKGIGVEKAKEIYLSTIKAELVYEIVDSQQGIVEPIYQFTPVIEPSFYVDSIDAMNGDMLEYSGEIINVKLDSYKETSALDHYYLVLEDEGILTEVNEKENNQLVNKRDVVRMLVNATGRKYYKLKAWKEEIHLKGIDKDDPDYKKLCLLIADGIILNEDKEWNWDSPVTKEELVTYLARAAGYTEMLESPDVSLESFGDSERIAPAYRQHIELAKSQGIIKGNEDGNFLPKKEVTYGELMTIFYSFLVEQ